MLKRFVAYYKPQKRLFILDLMAAFLVAAIDLFYPIYSKNMINDYIPNGQVKTILVAALVLLGLYILRLGAQYFMSYWGHVVGARMEYAMRRDLFSHLHTLDISFFDKNKTGKIMSRLVGDLRDIAELAHHGPEDLFISIVLLLGSFIILIRIHMVLTLIAFAQVIILFFYTYHTRFAMSKASKNVRSVDADMNAKIENSISGVRLSKSFANEEHEEQSFSNYNKRHLASRSDFFKAMGIFHSGSNFLVDVMSLSILVFGGIFVYDGQINLGELVAYLLFSNHFLMPIRRLIQFMQQFETGFAGFERVMELMDVKPSIEDIENPIQLEEIKGRIEFKQVDFQYAKGDMVLKNFDLLIPPGKSIALVGPSGVGKTTISKLIPRFYEVSGGEVSIDGYNVKNLSLSTIRKNIGIVEQDVFIYFGSIRDNILYGKLDATEEELIHAAKQAHIHEFIMSLSDGYNTLVGERGVRLSGGQKQRVAIARVFLKNPPILILDEATSSLDNESEKAIQMALAELSKGRTTLTIAHRLSTIINADEIIVLSDQGIVERGDHEGLIAQGGHYARLYQAQFKGYLPDFPQNGSKKN